MVIFHSYVKLPEGMQHMHQISDTTYGHRSGVPGVPASQEEVKGSAEGLEGLPGYLHMIYDNIYI